MGMKPPYLPLAMAVVLIGQCSGQASEEVPGGRPPVRVRSRHLLLDSRLVERLDNARLALGTIRKHAANPLFREDKPWEPRFDNLYANVLYDEEDRLYKCWYSPFIRDSLVSRTPRERRQDVRYHDDQREMGVCYAVSRDGLKWEKPELGLVEFEGSKASNLVAVAEVPGVGDDGAIGVARRRGIEVHQERFGAGRGVGRERGDGRLVGRGVRKVHPDIHLGRIGSKHSSKA